MRDITWEIYEPKRRMKALNHIYPDGIRIPTFFKGKNIVHLPTVKCHIYTTTTGSMKNAFGGLLNTKRHYTHSVIHETLVDLLAIQKDIHTGIFTIMDGTFCGNGPGPRTMIPVEKGIILASADSVAIDAVATKAGIAELAAGLRVAFGESWLAQKQACEKQGHGARYDLHVRHHLMNCWNCHPYHYPG